MKKKTKKNKRRTVDINDESFEAMGQIIELTNAFCQNHLNEEYRELCEDLTWAIYEEGLPLEKGRPSGWASGIVHAIGFVNFLHDTSQSPHMTSAQLAEGFGVSQQTMLTKSKIIRDKLDLIQFDPEWCLPALLEDNPLVWMLEVDGLIVDARDAPLAFQQEVYRQGLIPYVPGDNSQPKVVPEQDSKTRIIQFPAGRNQADEPDLAQKSEEGGPTLFDKRK
jgi:hypothetical protein